MDRGPGTENSNGAVVAAVVAGLFTILVAVVTLSGNAIYGTIASAQSKPKRVRRIEEGDGRWAVRMISR